MASRNTPRMSTPTTWKSTSKCVFWDLNAPQCPIHTFAGCSSTVRVRPADGLGLDDAYHQGGNPALLLPSLSPRALPEDNLRRGHLCSPVFREHLLRLFAPMCARSKFLAATDRTPVFYAGPILPCGCSTESCVRCGDPCHANASSLESSHIETAEDGTLLGISTC